jgi:hypothetical protein
MSALAASPARMSRCNMTVSSRFIVKRDELAPSHVAASEH